MHLPPIACRQLLLELPQHTFRRAQDVASPALLEKRHVVGRYHATVHHPDPVRFPVLALHRLHDLLHGRDVAAIAGEDFVAQRQAAAAHHQGDVDLFAVWTVVPRIASLRLWIRFRRALEIGARDVVQQQVVVELE